MIEYTTGDILKEEADALVNTVNCVGVMGRGIALQFKNHFPENFKAYKAACDREEVQPGRMFIVKNQELFGPRYIINFPTKRHWKGKSRMEDIEAGLETLAKEIMDLEIRTVAIPPLGSGLGGLNWEDVRSKIGDYLGDLSDVRISVYEPYGSPENVKCREVPKMTPGRATLIALMDRYLYGLMDPFVNLLEVHKLMYFMQAAGEPLKLQFKKGHYGPYAENLRHVLNAVEGHLITGFSDGGEQPDKQLKLLPGAVTDARNFLENKPDARKRFNRVTELVEGFETSFGLELLSTVHWVSTHEKIKTNKELLDNVYEWNNKKQKFTPRQINIANDTLTQKGWLN